MDLKRWLVVLGLVAVGAITISCESIPRKEQEVDLSTLNTPGHIAKVEEVDTLLLYGQGYYDLGDFENALYSYNQVLTIESKNVEAKRGKLMSERALELENQQSFLDYKRY